MAYAFTHPRRKGPGRITESTPNSHKAGSKLARKAFEGTLTIRNGWVGAAGRLALEGKLGNLDKHGMRRS